MKEENDAFLFEDSIYVHVSVRMCEDLQRLEKGSYRELWNN